jgi:hypothetical protein
LGVKRFFFASLKEIIITTITIKNKLKKKKEKALPAQEQN